MKLSYLYAKVIDRLRGKAVLNSIIDKSSIVGSGCNIINCQMDRYSYIGRNSQICNAQIGSFCSISDNVSIGGGEHPIQWVSTSPVFQDCSHGPRKLKRFSDFSLLPAKVTIIGNDVWIGHGVTIKQGVAIGDGAVIGSNALVTKDVEPYAIVGGVPAKVIKYRFDNDTISDLLKIKWWEWSDQKIAKYSNMMNNLKVFVTEVIRKEHNYDGLGGGNLGIFLKGIITAAYSFFLIIERRMAV